MLSLSLSKSAPRWFHRVLLGTLMGTTMFASSAFAKNADKPEQYSLEKVVVLMRHGVRPQTDREELNKKTGKEWPKWSVADGLLTGHGYAGVMQQAHYALSRWKAEGLPIKDGCAGSNDVFIWSSPVQRTVATARALADGMFAGCGVKTGYTEKESPLFQAADMQIFNSDDARVQKQVLDAMGGSPEKAAQKYAPDVERLRQAVCGTAPDDCKFMAEPWGIKVSKGGKYKLTGPVSTGSSIAETIRLQYSEGLPLEDVAFGHAKNAKEVGQLMALHAAKYDLVANTKEIAINGGSILMGEILNALADGTNIDNEPHDKALNKPLVVFVGHDTNISQIQTIIGFHWHLGEYPADDIPPGSMLSFERYRENASGKQFIAVSFTARSLDQWRSLTPLDDNAQPLSQAFNQAGCIAYQHKYLCEIKKFIDDNRKDLKYTDNLQYYK